MPRTHEPLKACKPGRRNTLLSFLLSKATTTPVAPAVPRVFAFSMQAEKSIVVGTKSPGGISSPHGLILFYGVCVLCSAGCRVVSKRDRGGYFRFVPILWPRDARSLSSSASILIARILCVRGERPGLCKIRSHAAHCACASALAVDMGLLLHPTGDPRRDL
jgi:hypothetical protein